MNWHIRHQGSPHAVEGLSLQQVVDGLLDGQWEPTDEVQGPGETEWVAIENHPQLAEIAADIDPPLPPQHDDETRIDMTALIDVTLVLLIFFILTTTYAALQKRLEAPSASKDKVAPRVVTTKQLAEEMIHLVAKMDNGQPIIKVENEEVALNMLVAKLRAFAKSTGKTILILEHDGNVPHGTVVEILDAANEARMSRVSLVVP
jgi:biopolymer transport protein ExbD